jgi:predicted negative regulator of RcsB-dependent stress response
MDIFQKPKLIDNKLLKKIIIKENTNKLVYELYFIEFIKNNYKIVALVLIIIISLYWRYNYIKNKRLDEYEESSVDLTSEDN